MRRTRVQLQNPGLPDLDARGRLDARPKELGTASEYRRRMRASMTGALRGMEAANVGSAFIPEDALLDFMEARALMERVVRRLSVKEWGR